jgi:DNA-3-methyladenine glycosylase I
MTGIGVDGKRRCFGWQKGKEFYAAYHDEEWGVPVRDDDRLLFEMLILEGCQAGLSWEIILKRRKGYREAYYNFDPVKVAVMSDDELEDLREEPSIIRNRLKIYAARKNAIAFLEIQKEFGSFSRYIWDYVADKPIINQWEALAQFPCESSESQVISKDLKRRGMTFVGSKIIYAFMQAVGMINDHSVECWCRKTT